MKKIADFFAFALPFVAMDLTFFFSIYAIHALTIKGYSISSALSKGGLEILWRVVFQQLTIQILLFGILFLMDKHRSLILLLLSSVLAYFVTLFVFGYRGSLLKVFVLFTKSDVGEGFAIFISVLLAWVCIEGYRRFTS